MKHIDLERFASGAFTTQINRAMEEVANNIQDPNTDATAARKITITISLKPNEQRNFVATAVVTKTALAPALGAVTAMSVGKNLKTGEVDALEIGNQIPGQMSLDEAEDVTETVVEVVEKRVDPSTGEIFETPIEQYNNIVDLRAKQA